MSPNKSLQTKLTGVFNRLNIQEKTPSPGTPGTPGTAETVLDNDSITTDLASPIDNNYENLQNEIYKLQNEKKILEQKQEYMDKIYKDVPIPPTEIVDKNGHILYTLCPLTTNHPEDALLFNERGIRVKKENLFKDSPVLPPQPPQHNPNKSRKRNHKSPSPKTPPQRKTQKTPPSPGHKSSSPGHKSHSPGNKSKRKRYKL